MTSCFPSASSSCLRRTSRSSQLCRQHRLFSHFAQTIFNWVGRLCHHGPKGYFVLPYLLDGRVSFPLPRLVADPGHEPDHQRTLFTQIESRNHILDLSEALAG